VEPLRENGGDGVEDPPAGASRRRFLSWLSRAVLAGGLAVAYGGLAALFGRFLYPARGRDRRWLFVQEVAAFPPGASQVFRLPDGRPVNITRRGENADAGSFLALSSTCPHLGCQVHWEAHNQRFFCPCHNGVFTPEGKAIAGPPADAGQSLLAFPLKVEGGLLFVEAPLETLTAQGRG
jgi:nitrite reductase/ring-hydroxylating ferredoxin subunit